VVAHLAVVSWCNIWSSEIMNISAGQIGNETSVPHLKRIHGLDGLRAFAVMLVFISHMFMVVPELLGQTWYRVFPRGGYLGVNGFFVLSGFLITYRLLGTAHHDGRFRWRQFYVHRAVRLFPAMFFVLAAHFVYAMIFDFPPLGVVADEWTMVRSTIFQYANWTIYKHPLLLIDNVSLWSLSIEGQFYILWPAVAYVIFQKTKMSIFGLLVLTTGIILLSFHRAFVFNDLGWYAVYLRSDTRFESLLIGALGGFVWLKTDYVKAQFVRVMSIPATVCVILMVCYSGADGSFIWKGGMTLFDASILVIILALAADVYPGGKLLTARPTEWVGRISYGLYLWQIPIFRIIDRHGSTLSSSTRLVLAVTGVFGVSILSWYALERPVMKSRWAKQLAGN
jgi:peptidoglycan/LPS O-acetylase OafA/YrhL